MNEKHINSIMLLVLMVLLSATSVYAHCEVPCGIYGDEMRLDMIAEHITTVEKSMKMVAELSKEPETNYNQLARWITNKEEHANRIQNIVYQYFMTQRVKPVDEDKGDSYKKYVKQLTLLHHMLVYAMKTKQTTDLTNVDKLRDLLEEFRAVYVGGEHKR